ncbi:MAG: mandelate racemase/muconate lactonizing enzyme family protein [Anaerolineae bacterium]|nr:mandelate racemase/muconate lactonizing enzyme family protein [Anaerolineae bacterium]
MRITDIRTFLVNPTGHRAGMIGGKNWLFVKLETDEGIVGWGEAYTQLDRDRNIAQTARDLGRYLIGLSPFRIKHFTQMVYDDFAGRRGSMELFCALSGIEQALWDIVGKQLGTPVYNLLGGPCRDRIRVYANGWYGGAKTPEQYAQMAQAVVARGFTALKFDPFPGPWRLYVDKEVERKAIANVGAVREAVGPDVDILIEVHRRLSPMHAIRVGQAMEAFSPFWFEEPVPVENAAALAEVRAQVDIPIVTGETLYTKAAFRDVFEQRAADIINPDVCNCGGILELKEIAAMAEPSFVAVSPHNYNSTTIGLAATVQAAACMPNFLITEYFVNFEETSREIVDIPLEVRGGYIPLPERPGLGVELVEEELNRRPYEEQPPRAMPDSH